MQGNEHSFHSRTPEDTCRYADALGRVIAARPDPFLVIALHGDLGAGKTVFVHGLATGLGLPEDLVASPTFVLAHQYPRSGGSFLNHIDLYRLDDESELDGMGFDELLDPPAVAAVEWAGRFPRAIPKDHLAVALRRGPALAPGGGTVEPVAPTDAQRQLKATAFGVRSASILDSWIDALRA